MRVYDDKIGLPKVSATKIKTFLTCPKKYMYRYILEIDDPKNIYAVLGLSIHKTIAEYYTQGKEPRITFINTWDSFIEEYKLKNDTALFRRGLNIVDSYPHYDDYPSEVESEYFVPYPEQSPICVLHVIFDQVYPWGIRDLKTSKTKPSLFDIKHDLQFILYSHAFEYIYGKKPKVVWHHLETNEDLSVVIDVDSTYTKEIIDALLKQQDYYRRVGDHCRYCSYRKECLGE